MYLTGQKNALEITWTTAFIRISSLRSKLFVPCKKRFKLLVTPWQLKSNQWDKGFILVALRCNKLHYVVQGEEIQRGMDLIKILPLDSIYHTTNVVWHVQK